MIRKNATPVFKSFVISLSFVMTFFAASLVRAEHNSEHSIIDRIKPVGVVCTAGENCDEAAPEPESAAAAPAEAAQVASAARSGEDVYNQSCVVCHGAGVAGAPIVGNTEAWAPRIGKGMDALMASATNGLNAMPPRGTCMNCSDDELHAAVQFMVESSQ